MFGRFLNFFGGAIMARTMCGIWVVDVSGSQWRRSWEDPCSSCEAKESGECPGGIFDDDDDDDDKEV